MVISSEFSRRAPSAFTANRSFKRPTLKARAGLLGMLGQGLGRKVGHGWTTLWCCCYWDPMQPGSIPAELQSTHILAQIVGASGTIPSWRVQCCCQAVALVVLAQIVGASGTIPSWRVQCCCQAVALVVSVTTGLMHAGWDRAHGVELF